MIVSEESYQQLLGEARQVARVLRLPHSLPGPSAHPGHRAAPRAGASPDFHDHRPYQPGDDIRHLNWSAYARTGQHTLKQYQEETRPLLDLLFDPSPSMFHPDAKARLSLSLLLFVHQSALLDQLHIRLHLLLPQPRLLPAAELGTSRWLAQIPPPAPELPATLPALPPLRPRSLRILISDLLTPDSPARLLKSLTPNAAHCLILAPYDPAESDPAWHGPQQFIDAETTRAEAHHLSPRQLQHYRQRYQQHFQNWQEDARRHRASFHHLPTGTKLLNTLRNAKF
ncbi:MAG: DUF58 domain-containing protein [Verrucomicrobiales bacterium]